MRITARCTQFFALVLLLSSIPIVNPLFVQASPLASIERIERSSAQLIKLFIRSPAMGRTVPVQVITPMMSSGVRPTLYLLDGADSSEISSTWVTNTDVESFFTDKNVTVVLPVGGRGSYYTDWQKDDPVLGRQKWETFLTQELPPIIDAKFNGNGVNAIAGLSMGAHAALILTARNPLLYKAVGFYSGCASTSDPVAQASVQGTVISKEGDPNNMWGQVNDPDWIAHDPMIQAGNLRGKALYISAATGLPGEYDTEEIMSAAGSYPEVLAAASALEGATHYCTRLLEDRLHQMGVSAEFRYRPTGTHAWPYWQEALHDSWSVIGPALA
ncbi:MAG: alpha/beta hydrolase [Mycobacteriaceae bacterium]